MRDRKRMRTGWGKRRRMEMEMEMKTGGARPGEIERTKEDEEGKKAG